MVSSSDPGTSAVSTPAPPMTPTNHGGNVRALTASRDRSPSANPGTTSTAANPANSASSRTSWYSGRNTALRRKTRSSLAL